MTRKKSVLFPALLVVTGLGIASFAYAETNIPFSLDKMQIADSGSADHDEKGWHRKGKRGHGPKLMKIINRVASKLELNAEQNEKLNVVKSMISDIQEENKALRKSMKKNKSDNFLEMLDRREMAVERRLANFQKIKPAITDLYNSLTDEQKEKLDSMKKRWDGKKHRG